MTTCAVCYEESDDLTCADCVREAIEEARVSAAPHEGDGSCEDCGCAPTTEHRLCHNCYEQGMGRILEEARGWLLSFNVTPEATREDLVRELGRLRRTLMKGVE